MSNGEPLVLRASMKPLSTLSQPLDTVDLSTGKAAVALRERSDVCAVPAAAVVGEAACLLALMNPFLEKFGGDSLIEIMNHLKETPGLPWD
jgi:chorismate synthase